MRQVSLDQAYGMTLEPAARAAMLPFYSESYGNPSAMHHLGIVARDAVTKAKEQVARLLNAESPEEVIFTGSGEEAVDLAIQGYAMANARWGRHLVFSALEPECVARAVAALCQRGFVCTRVPVDAEGLVTADRVEAVLRDDTILVVLSHANPVLGTVQAIAELGRQLRERGIGLFLDLTYSAGWLPIDVRALNASLAVVSPRHFGGPAGVGLVYRHSRTRINAVVRGGNQQDGRRAGTENVPAIVGVGAAAMVAHTGLEGRAAHATQLQVRLWDGWRTRLPSGRLLGPSAGARRLPTNLCIDLCLFDGERFAVTCASLGLRVRHMGSDPGFAGELKGALEAIGEDASVARRTIVMNLCASTTEAEISTALEIAGAAVETLQSEGPARIAAPSAVRRT